MQKGNNLAHHLIQSFAPGETTPEQAHEIGRQLADEVLQGKYPVSYTHLCYIDSLGLNPLKKLLTAAGTCTFVVSLLYIVMMFAVPVINSKAE